MLSVTIAAADLDLLTIEELRAAVGATDHGRDADLARAGTRVAAMIAQACKIWADGATPPTLRKETLTETSRLSRAREQLSLARRPLVSVTSVTVDGVAYGTTDYEIVAGAGILRRLSGDSVIDWPAGKTIVVYEAGWDTVPEDLKQAAAKLVNLVISETARDPLVRREDVVGVGSIDYWVGPIGGRAIPADVMEMLSPYINHNLG